MMVLSRLWYVVLALLLGISTYVVFLAVGEYDRRNAVAMGEELASDSQTVGWKLQIDARKRLDALLIGVVDKGVQDSLQAAAGKDKIPGPAKETGRRSLHAILDKIPAEYRPDALFAVDHDGRMVSQVGFDAVNEFPDFELGGYPAVFDALHGFLRDDTWVLGGKAYRVVARPVEVDSTQPPLGAIVALKAIDKTFAQYISKQTRTNVAFFAGGARIATAVVGDFPEAKFTAVDSDMLNLASDKGYADGRSDLRLSDDLGAIYARFVGDAWDLGAGFVVVRTKTTIGGPLGFLNGADDTDKQSVNIALIGGIVFAAFAIGILLSILEQTLPMRQMEKQAGALRRGELDYLQVARFRGGYRGIAENINVGIERVLEKGGGAARKPADLESILGPVPAQPAMSAFAFPLPEGGATIPTVPNVPPASNPAIGSRPLSGAFQGPPGHQPPHPPPHPPPHQGAHPHPPVNHPPSPTAPAVPGPPPPRPRPPVAAPPSSPSATALAAAPPAPPAHAPAPAPLAMPPAPTGPRASSPAFPPAGPPIPPPIGAGTRPGNFQIALDDSPDSVDGDGPTLASALSPTGIPMVPSPISDEPHVSPAAGKKPEAPVKLGMAGRGGPAVGTQTMMGIGLTGKPSEDNEEESTVIARAPSELLAAATGPSKAVSDETAEWMSVYDEFLRTKKQCEEPTDGLSFEKFQNTLRKNRDALVQRHQCKRVRFSVYIKDGRASLKATPVKE